jgi:tetratricopeptide (TPR) repeat protein
MSYRRSIAIFTLLVAGPAIGADSFEQRFELARVLTWKTESRARGVEDLRALVAERPDAVEPRFELARVLTWSPETRAEGVGMLRQLHAERPASAEFAETLAEVLSWDAATRAESIEILRGVVAREPERASASMALAQVLAWSPATRDEAEAIYRDALAKDPDSVEAKVGLARLLSWRGDLEASTSYYREALRHSPSDAAAATGLAEVQGWSGRPLASLDTLDEITGADQSAEVRRARGAAYASLGMPGKARDEYEAALALDPSDNTSRLAAQDLETKMRPRITVGGGGFTESGDPGTDRLEMVAIPVTFEMGIGGNLTLAIVGARGSFENDLGTTRTTSYGAGISGALGRRVKLWSRFQQNDLDVADSEWTADVDLAFAVTDRVELRAGGARTLLFDSRLSAVGETTASTLYGPAVLESASVGATVRIGTHWDVVATASSGTIAGTGFLDNDRTTLYGGFGRTFAIGHGWLRAGASFYRMEHDLDLSGFPQTDLGGDGVTTRGIGGYFSPFEFTNAMVRVDAAFPAGDKVRFRLSGAVGQQSAEDVFSDGSSDETSSEAMLGMAWRIHPRVSMDVEVGRMDVASAFDRTRATMGWTFGF